MQEIMQSLLSALRITSANFALLDVGSDGFLKCDPSQKTLIHLVLEGSLTLQNEASNNSVCLTAGDYVMVRHDIPHSISASSFNHRKLYQNSFAEAAESMPNWLVIGKSENRVKILCGSLTGSLSYIKRIRAALFRKFPELIVLEAGNRSLVPARELEQVVKAARSPGGNEVLKRMAELLVLDELRLNFANLELPPEPNFDSQGASSIVDALAIMSEEMDRKLSISEIADRVNMSRSAFRSAFNDFVGQSPLRHLTKLRMTRAEELLRSESLSVKEISFIVGYSSEIAFSRLFKKHHHLTPSEYRNKYSKLR